MKTSDLEEMLNQFISKPNYRSILIDGPWGCGKTFQMETAIKKYDNIAKKDKTKNKIVMISVFGFQSIDEIHTTLYRKFHPKIVAAKKAGSMALSIISKSIELLPTKSLFPTDALTNAIDIVGENLGKLEEPKENVVTQKDNIIVFDDIERLSENIHYDDFLGYLSNLVQSGIKIICICNTLNINKKKLVKFVKFKEKLFERVYEINETNLDLINDMFNEYKVSLHLYDIVDQFGNNLRFARKVYYFFKEIMDYINKNFSNYETAYSLDIILYSCIEVIKDAFSIKNEKAKFAETYQDTIAELKECFNDFYLYSDKSKLDSLFQFYQKEKQKDYPSIFRKPYFFLSDKNKEKYKDEFIKYISNSSSTWDYSMGTIFINISSSTHNFSSSDLQNIASCILRSGISIDSAFFTQEINSYQNVEKISEYKLKIEEIIKNNQLSEYKKSLKSASSEKNYNHLTDIFYEIVQNQLKSNDELIKYIINNNFFFPEIDGDIDWSIWSYCTQVTYSFNSLPKYKNEFLNYLDSLLTHDCQNESLKQRINILKSLA